MGSKEILNLPMRKQESTEKIFEAGRKNGEYNTRKSLRIEMLNLSFHYFRDELAYSGFIKEIEKLFVKK